MSEAYEQPEFLFADADSHRLPRERSLAVIITVDFPHTVSRGDALTDICRLAQWLADEHELASLAVIHAPSEAGYSLPLHGHILTPVRQLTTAGWGPVVTWPLNPQAPVVLHGQWAALVRR